MWELNLSTGRFIIKRPDKNASAHYRMAAPKIGNYINSKSGKCEVYIAPFAVFLNEDSTTYIEPDLVVICDTSKITEEGCKGAPDFIIEVGFTVYT